MPSLPNIGRLTPRFFGAALGKTLPMNNRQEATTIAALRLWQGILRGDVIVAKGFAFMDECSDQATDSGLHDPLTADEIDELLADVFRTI